MLRQSNDAWPTMPIATRTLHVAQRHTNGCFRVARLNAQIQINNGVATVADNDQPVVLGNKRGTDLRPEPCLTIGSIEAAHDVKRLSPRLPVALHALNGLDALVAVGTAVLLGHGSMAASFTTH